MLHLNDWKHTDFVPLWNQWIFDSNWIENWGMKKEKRIYRWQRKSSVNKVTFFSFDWIKFSVKFDWISPIEYRSVALRCQSETNENENNSFEVFYFQEVRPWEFICVICRSFSFWSLSSFLLRTKQKRKSKEIREILQKTTWIIYSNNGRWENKRRSSGIKTLFS